MKQGVLWTGMILILVTSMLAASAQERPTFEPLRAKIVVEHTDSNQAPATETGQFYRDAEGRTRVEIGNHIIITDPVARTRYDLDTEQHVAHSVLDARLARDLRAVSADVEDGHRAIAEASLDRSDEVQSLIHAAFVAHVSSLSARR